MLYQAIKACVSSRERESSISTINHFNIFRLNPNYNKVDVIYATN